MRSYLYVMILLVLAWANTVASRAVDDSLLLQYNVTRASDQLEPDNKLGPERHTGSWPGNSKRTGHQRRAQDQRVAAALKPPRRGGCDAYKDLFKLYKDKTSVILESFIKGFFKGDCPGKDAKKEFKHLKGVVKYLLQATGEEDGSVQMPEIENESQPGVGKLTVILMTALEKTRSAIAKTLALKYQEDKAVHHENVKHRDLHFAEHYLKSMVVSESEYVHEACLTDTPNDNTSFYDWVQVLKSKYDWYSSLQGKLEGVTCGKGWTCDPVRPSRVSFLCPKLHVKQGKVLCDDKFQEMNDETCCGPPDKESLVTDGVLNWGKDFLKTRGEKFLKTVAGEFFHKFLGPSLISLMKFLYIQYDDWRTFTLDDKKTWLCGALKWEFIFVNSFLKEDEGAICDENTHTNVVSSISGICNMHEHHVAGLDKAKEFRELKKEKMKDWMESESADSIGRIINYSKNLNSAEEYADNTAGDGTAGDILDVLLPDDDDNDDNDD